MSLSFLTSLLSRTWRGPMLFYAGVWTTVLTLTVAVAAVSPEMAFIWAISPSSSFSAACGPDVRLSIRVPADLTSEVTCLPAKIFRQSKMDYVVPPIFAALVVASSACVVRAMGL